MEAGRGRSDEGPSGANGESKWISLDPVESVSGSKRRRRSTSALSDETLERLKDETYFPNLSTFRRQYIKTSILAPSIPGFGRPNSRVLCDEYVFGSYFDSECPIYSESLVDVPKVELGKPLNVLDLLGDNLLRFSNGSRNVDGVLPTKFKSSAGSPDPDMGSSDRCVCMCKSGTVVPGKYVMIFCVFVPSMWSSVDGPMVYHAALASHELAKRDDFVLVVVPMMRDGFTHSCSAYQCFLSGFSCHAVPFEDSLRREYICSALGFDGDIKVLILDPSQKALYHGPPDMFLEFGGAERDCFPFTPERQEICFHRDDVLEDRSLNELLGLGDTDFLYDIKYHDSSRLLKEHGRITISELKQKFVGIYVYSDGTCLKKLREVKEECRRLNYELEIVVVCCPFYWHAPPDLHAEPLIDALKIIKLVDCWFLPFDNTACHRLRRMCEASRYEEGLIIVDPIEKRVDPYGFPIICDFGMDAYPFTRRTLIDKEYQRKTGLGLDALLLPWGYPFMAMLKNKIVVLYMYKEQSKDLADKLAAWYKNNIMGKHSSTTVEVVTVSIDGSRGSGDEELFMDMGWLVCPTDPSKSAKLCEEFFHPLLGGARETVVAFGEDGRIQSLSASHILESQGPPFLGDLRDAIALEFRNAGFEYMSY